MTLYADKLRLINAKVVSDERPRTDFVRDENDFPEGWERAQEEHALEFGDYSNVHPRVKHEVGRRAALQALRLMGEDVLAHGPVTERADLGGDLAVITFGSVGEGLEKRRVVMARSPGRGWIR